MAVVVEARREGSLAMGMVVAASASACRARSSADPPLVGVVVPFPYRIPRGAVATFSSSSPDDGAMRAAANWLAMPSLATSASATALSTAWWSGGDSRRRRSSGAHVLYGSTWSRTRQGVDAAMSALVRSSSTRRRGEARCELRRRGATTSAATEAHRLWHTRGLRRWRLARHVARHRAPSPRMPWRGTSARRCLRRCGRRSGERRAAVVARRHTLPSARER